MVRIFNKTKNNFIAERGVIADTFLTRMVGLLKRDHLDDDEALVIRQCKSIHMVFMRFSIDVVFVDEQKKIIGCIEDIHPFQFSPVFWKASFSIELPSGTISRKSISIGDVIEIFS